jgi:hypothetical protein
VGSPDQGLQAFSLDGGLVLTFDSIDQAGNPLLSGDQEPWGAAEDGQGHVWVTRYSPSMTDDAILEFDDTGTYLQVIDPPGDLGGYEWIPLGVAVLSDGTMAVASAGFQVQPTLALFTADGSTQLDVTLAFQSCKDPGNGGTPTCENDNSVYGAAAGVLVRNGQVLVSTQDSPPGPETFIGAFTDPDLGFVLSTAKTTASPDDGFDTTGFNTLADDGVYIIAAQATNACLIALDPRTLYIPTIWSDDLGCLPPNVTSSARPVVLHLSP